MIPYLQRLFPDSSQITLEYYNSISQIRFLDADRSIPLHQHDFYELVLIQRGSCRHFYRNTYIPLIPGDLFLIPPNCVHAYHFHDSIAMFNCQFDISAVTAQTSQFVSEIEFTALQQIIPTHKRIDDIKSVWTDAENRIPFGHVGSINNQGIIHLNHMEHNNIASLMQQILKEQETKNLQFEYLKQILLETILVQLKRIQMNQFENKDHSPTWQTEMIDIILNQIDMDIAAPYDFNVIAEKEGISISYFRMIFKSHTGLSPLEYLNRVRILRALELLQTTRHSISDIAEQVGIHDPNYFTRVFKKLIGYPPSYFKSI